ncbi:MAG: DUF4856 domain-containing protein [Saprospiraceae bacterium]|nr:DUF4856 domain-containing protein [Saprospiraceae bacterium]
MPISPYLIAFIFLGLLACNDEDPSPSSVVPPTGYAFERDGISTISFTGQTVRIGMATELANALKDFDSKAESLLEMYANETAAGTETDPFQDADLNASTKSIRSKVAASKDIFGANATESARIKQDFEDWIINQVEEIFPNEYELAAPGKPGQIADGTSVRFVNARGLEYDQAVNKGLIGALMVDQIINNYLSPAVLDEGQNRSENDNGITVAEKPYTNMEHKWDEAYGYIFGTSAFPKDPIRDLGADAFLNKYLARVNGDSDFEGIAQQIVEAFTLGRAAIVAKNYAVRDEQSALLRGLISKVIGVRAVYYLQQGKNGLPTTGDDFGGAFHDLSEGFGFIYSLRFTRDPNGSEALFSREEVDGYLDQLTAGSGFWEVTSETLDQLSQEIASRFDFTVGQAGS